MELDFWSAAESFRQIFDCSAALNTEAFRAFWSWECGKRGILNEQTRENYRFPSAVPQFTHK